MNQKGSKQESTRIEYHKINKKQTSYLSVYNLSIIFATKWHSICITNKYKVNMPQKQKYGGKREIDNKQRKIMNMNFDNFTNVTSSQERDLEMSRVFPSLMRKVYVWMAMALAITGVIAYGAGNSPALIQLLYMGRGPLLVAGLVEVGIVWYLSSRIQKLSLVAATVWFIVFAAINGFTLGWIFAAFSSAAIAKTFFITAGTFGAMALIGSTTKKDLTKMGGILFMALIGLIIAGLVNIFLKSTMFDLIVSGIGVLVFTGLTAWDAQKIKQNLRMALDAGEGAQKVALLGSLSLYLDFINLFLYLLRFLGNNRN